jgi:AAA domain
MSNLIRDFIAMLPPPDEEFEQLGAGKGQIWRSLELTPAQRPVFERIKSLQVGADSAGMDSTLVEPSTVVTPIRPGLVVPKRRIITPTPFVLRPSKDLEPRDWMYGRHLIRKFLSTVFAPGAAGKTSLIFARVLSLVTGIDLLNVGEMDKSKLRAWVVNGEDPMDELERRINAICDHYKITENAIGGRLFVDSGRDTNIKIAVQDRGSTRIVQPDVDRIIECMQEREIDLLVIDPAVSFHAIPENDNTGIEMFASEWARIAEHTNSAVVLAHHVRKGGHGQQEYFVEDGRGAGALLSKARDAEVLNSMSEEEASRFGIDVQERGDYFRVEGGKPNMSKKSERNKTHWYKMVSVDLKNAKNGKKSDEVGVVTSFTPTPAASSVPNAALMEIAKRLDAAEHGENSQSTDWAGYVVGEVLGLDAEKGSKDRPKITAMLKTWIREGSLKVVRVAHPRRGDDRPIVRGGIVIPDFSSSTKAKMAAKVAGGEPDDLPIMTARAPAEVAGEPDHDPATGRGIRAGSRTREPGSAACGPRPQEGARRTPRARHHGRADRRHVGRNGARCAGGCRAG